MRMLLNMQLHEAYTAPFSPQCTYICHVRRVVYLDLVELACKWTWTWWHWLSPHWSPPRQTLPMLALALLPTALGEQGDLHGLGYCVCARDALSLHLCVNVCMWTKDYIAWQSLVMVHHISLWIYVYTVDRELVVGKKNLVVKIFVGKFWLKKFCL